MLQTANNRAVRGVILTELRGLEVMINKELSSDLECVNKLVDHVGRYQGKMLRSRLLLLAAMACHRDSDVGNGVTTTHRVAACVVEIVHLATLVHDDILDEAQIRRQGITINHLHGNEAAVMLGDYLISHAYHLCCGLGRSDIGRLITEVTNTVCEGELLQLANRNNWLLDESTYFSVISRKTASLFGACGRLAARISNAGPEVEESLFEYGHKLGMAYQIIDDLLDLTAEEQQVGKTLGRDLDMGKLTLPLIRYLAVVDSRRRDRMIDMLIRQSSPVLSDERRLEQSTAIRDYLGEGQCMNYARDKAVECVEEAKRILINRLPYSQALEILLDFADTFIVRGV